MIPTVQFSVIYRNRVSQVLCILVGFVALLTCLPSFAIDRELKLDQLNHTAWTIRDGAPANIRGIAETVDGAFWIGAGDGLYRFDGISFRKFQASSGDVLAGTAVLTMLGVPDGSLWVGFRSGGVSQIRAGIVRSFGTQDGVPPGLVKAFTRDRRGSLWVLTTDGIARFDGAHWENHGSEWNLPKDCLSLFSDHNGTIWIGTKYTLRYLLEGGSQFRTAADHLEFVASIAESPTGSLWIAEANRAVRPAPLLQLREENDPTSIRVGSNALLFDSQGALWITTLGDGIRRVRYVDRLKKASVGEFDSGAEIFTKKDGLSHDFESCIFQDHESNIWIATNAGLDRFRQTPLVPVSFPSGSSRFSLAADLNGHIFVGSSNRPLSQVEDGEARSLGIANGVSSEYTAPDGAVWMVWVDSLGRFSENHLELIAPPSGTSLLHAFAMTSDSSGAIWVCFADLGVFRYAGGRWVNFRDLGGRPDAAFSAFTDAAGRVWFGYRDNSLLLIDHGQVRSITGKDHVPVGEVRSIQGYKKDLWIGGSQGVGLLFGDTFRRAVPADRDTFTEVSGLIQTKDNGLWFGESHGILHIPQDQIDFFKTHPDHRVTYETFSYLDGLPSPLQTSHTMESSVQGAHGRLWFATTDGLVWINQQATRTSARPPTASIESFASGGQQRPMQGSFSLPAYTRQVRIEYTAWNLATPEGVRFRYRMQGLSRNWQDVGKERQASFMALVPGHYRFEVVARNGDGAWNTLGAVVEFDIAPAWYQSLWFHLLCGVMVLVVLYVLYTFRLRQATKQVKVLLKERVQERERIARELHDTLLQGFQGLMLRLQAVMEAIPPDLSARSHMEKVLDRADDVLVEGRNRVLDLRAESLTADSLAEALSAFADDLRDSYTASFTMIVEPTPWSLDPVILDEVSRIGREAIANAFRHSSAENIICTIAYDAYRLRVSIQDDGHGLDSKVIKVGKSGHWGIPGMQERARRIGGQLNIWSDASVGTEIVLNIPAEVAYRKEPLRKGWWRFRRFLRLGS
jgi:signal transduction histidine kinase/streptogramin lyase